MATHPSNTGGGGPAPPAGTYGDDEGSLGGLIRRARERRGLTLEQVSNETKIPRRHLAAIEHDNLSALPAGFYLRAEVRVYARAIHLDQDLALRALDRSLQPASARPPRARLATEAGATLTVSRQWLLILGCVLVATVGLALGMDRREPADRAAIGLSPPATGVVDTAPPSDAAPEETTPVRAVPATSAGSVSDPQVPAAAEEISAPPPEPARDDVPATAPQRAVDAAAASSQAVPSQPLPTPAAPSNESAATSEPSRPLGPAAPAPMLVLTTEPAGARVTVNGIGWGTAPIAIRYVSPGDKLLRVSKDGYVTEERLVHLVEGRPLRVDLQLRPAP